MRKKGFIIVIMFLCFLGIKAQSQSNEYPYDFTYNGNPLVRNHGAADPDVHVWGDTVWMYCSQDHEGGYSNMDGYHAFSSTDMINWTDHGDVFNSSMLDDSWGSTPDAWMWAPGAARKKNENGEWTYYLYYPHNVRFEGQDWVTGVATAPTPAGPFTELGPLKGGKMGMDPMVFIDDDGEAYIYANTLRVAKLKPDMITLAESPYWIEYDMYNEVSDSDKEGFAEGAYMHKKDGIYYFSYSNWKNDTYQAFYATSDNPYGPFDWQGPLAPNPQGAQDHHSIIEFQDQWYYFYHIAVPNIPEVKDGQSRIACYDRLYHNNDGTIQMVVHTYGPQNVLSISADNGTVTMNPPGGAYPPGKTVTITASGGLGWGFDSWGGDLSGIENPVSITMDSDKSISAIFSPIPIYELVTNASQGNIVLDPPGGLYNQGAEVTVNLIEYLGYEFSEWSGDVSGSDYPLTISMDSAINITAEFDFVGGAIESFAVNCGGSAYTASDGTKFSADENYSDGNDYSINDPISGTEDDKLYQSERYGNLSYNIDLPNGLYEVTLMFAEIYHNEAGNRIFNVSIEGIVVINNLDLYSEAGSKTAYKETQTVAVEDGQLNISLQTISDNAKISAIKVNPAIGGNAFKFEEQSTNGTVSIDPPGSIFIEGTEVTVTAEPNTGYKFSGWSGDLSGSDNPATITIDANKSVAANFTLLTSINDLLKDNSTHTNLIQNYPNPFSTKTTISYQLSTPGYVRISIHNLMGQEISVLVDDKQIAGVHQVNWEAKQNNGQTLPRGIYICRFETSNGEQTAKIIHTK